jgi:hypothetical protein
MYGAKTERTADESVWDMPAQNSQTKSFSKANLLENCPKAVANLNLAELRKRPSPQCVSHHVTRRNHGFDLSEFDAGQDVAVRIGDLHLLIHLMEEIALQTRPSAFEKRKKLKTVFQGSITRLLKSATFLAQVATGSRM